MGSVMAPPAPWPLKSGLELAAQPTVPGVVRGHVRAIACEWGLGELADTAELLASELATNAVQASERMSMRADLATVPVVRIWVTSDGNALIIHVWDASPEMPARRDIAVDQEGGRGLMVVDALGKEWGSYPAVGGGKVVWVMLTSLDR